MPNRWSLCDVGRVLPGCDENCAQSPNEFEFGHFGDMYDCPCWVWFLIICIAAACSAVSDDGFSSLIPEQLGSGEFYQNPPPFIAGELGSFEADAQSNPVTMDRREIDYRESSLDDSLFAPGFEYIPGNGSQGVFDEMCNFNGILPYQGPNHSNGLSHSFQEIPGIISEFPGSDWQTHFFDNAKQPDVITSDFDNGDAFLNGFLNYATEQFPPGSEYGNDCQVLADESSNFNEILFDQSIRRSNDASSSILPHFSTNDLDSALNGDSNQIVDEVAPDPEYAPDTGCQLRLDDIVLLKELLFGQAPDHSNHAFFQLPQSPGLQESQPEPNLLSCPPSSSGLIPHSSPTRPACHEPGSPVSSALSAPPQNFQILFQKRRKLAAKTELDKSLCPGCGLYFHRTRPEATFRVLSILWQEIHRLLPHLSATRRNNPLEAASAS